MPKTFDEFYYKSNNSKEYLDDLQEYVESNNNSLGKYQGQMYCPECQQAELSYVPKTSQRRAHLRRKPKEKHDEFCSYRYDYASKKFAQTYYTDLTDIQIQDRMDAMMRKLLNKPKITNEVTSPRNVTVEENPFVIENSKSEERIRKTLRRKSICKYLDRNVDTMLQLFYGKVRLKVVSRPQVNSKGESYTIHFLQIKCLNKEGKLTVRTSVYRGGKLDDFDENKEYHLVAIGHLKFSDNYPPVLQLTNQRALLIQEIVE